MENKNSNSMKPIPPDACHKGLPQLSPLAEVYKNLNEAPLGMVYIPIQQWGDTYDDDFALQAGTIFPELNLPFGRSGGKIL